MSIEERIEAYALQNAIRYGKALTGKVIPKILGEFPEARKDMKDLKPKIDAVVEEVNRLSEEERLDRLREIAPELLEKPKEEPKDLPELEHTEQGVVTRLPPEPSKYLHLGHALTFLINAMYAERYDGRLVLRFEDANPGTVGEEYVNAILEDLQYLEIEPDSIRYVSDDMDELLEYAEQLVKERAAYMCFCTREEISANRREQTDCPCREHTVEHNLEEWKKFKSGQYMEGQTVLRYMGDMQSKNSVLRDPVLWRAVQAEHFRTQDRYRIWPLYDFYSSVEEHLCGVTHVIRSNEFDLRVPLQHEIQRILGLTKPVVVHYGRFNIKDATTKGREIREAITSGEYTGWDDPRLVTLKALKRRGIQPAAYRALVKELGLSPYQVNIDFSRLAGHNRALVEPRANRYSFIEDPQRIDVQDVDPHTVQMDLHPDRKDGGRTLQSEGTYYVSKQDLKSFRGRIRLKDDLTFEVREGTYHFATRSIEDSDHDMIINWLPANEETVPVRIVMPDASVKKGLAEQGIEGLHVDDIIQFERFGFCRLDSKGSTYEFRYTHD